MRARSPRSKADASLKSLLSGGDWLGPLADSDKWEIRLQVVRALLLLSWTSRERRRVEEILRRDVEHSQRFVRAWAIDSLATLTRDNQALMPVVLRGLESFERSGSKALQTRARHIRRRISQYDACRNT